MLLQPPVSDQSQKGKQQRVCICPYWAPLPCKRIGCNALCFPSQKGLTINHWTCFSCPWILEQLRVRGGPPRILSVVAFWCVSSLQLLPLSKVHKLSHSSSELWARLRGQSSLKLSHTTISIQTFSLYVHCCEQLLKLHCIRLVMFSTYVRNLSARSSDPLFLCHL